MLWKICVTVKHQIKKASALINVTNSTAGFWKPSRKGTRAFVVCAVRSHDCFRTANGNTGKGSI